MFGVRPTWPRAAVGKQRQNFKRSSIIKVLLSVILSVR